MKKLFFLATLAAALLCSCNKDDASNNSITMDGKTYTDMDVYYRIENQHMFFLLIDIHSDIEIHGTGQVDTPTAFGEDLKGRSLDFKEGMDAAVDHGGFGYGDVICMYFYGDGFDYNMEPDKGTQVTKKIDDTHYSVKMDVTDSNGKVFKMDVTATKQVDK